MGGAGPQHPAGCCRDLPGGSTALWRPAALREPPHQPWEGAGLELMDLSRHFPLALESGPAGWVVVVEGFCDPPGLLAFPGLSCPCHWVSAGLGHGGHGGLGTVGSCRASFQEWNGRWSFALTAPDRDNNPDLERGREGGKFAEMENNSLS